MKKAYTLNGMKNDFQRGIFMKPEEYFVNITIDQIGATLSIGEILHDGKAGIQFSIPFDHILKDIKEEIKKETDDV